MGRELREAIQVMLRLVDDSIPELAMSSQQRRCLEVLRRAVAGQVPGDA